MTDVRVGQVWRAHERLKNGEARYVRIDRLETKPESVTILGLTRTREIPIARVSTRAATATEFKPTTRFIRVDRFASCYSLVRVSQ